MEYCRAGNLGFSSIDLKRNYSANFEENCKIYSKDVIKFNRSFDDL